ncbi:sperm-associated antigen 17 isoform X2 [Hydra vulgaris]|uniref:Sperm-associated antigen 17 isoform X2 n=1 Tax=Hydra vulgaris TaxID=6087 RepID=A0ABM4BIV0_HYDVU
MSKTKSEKASSEGYKSLIGLAEASFLQDGWRCFIGFLFPCNKHDLEVISIISSAINKKTRRRFTVIDCSLLIQEAIQLTQLNKSKGKSAVAAAAAAAKTPPFIEICDKVKELVDQGEHILPKIFSLLLKFKFLMIKEKVVAEKSDALKLNDDLNKVEIERSVSKLKSPSTVGKKPSKKIEIMPTIKKNTKMKLRGQEIDEVNTIDDEPDGEKDPDCYIIVVGIKDVSILGHLAEIKVPVNAVFKIDTEYKNICLSFDNEYKSEVVQIQINDVNTVDVPIVDQNFNLWKDINAIFKSKDFNNLLCDVAILEFYVSKECFPEQLLSSLDLDKKNLFAAWLFDRLSQICYKYLESYKDYQLYLNSINILDVSFSKHLLSPLVETTPTKLPGEENSLQVNDLRYYNKLMSFFPTQSENVNIILDCLLEQVVVLINGNQTFKEKTSELKDVDELVENYMNNILGHIGTKSKSVYWNKKQDIAQKSLIVYYGDKAKLDLINVCNEEIYFFKCEERMKNVHPYAKLMDYSEFNEEKLVKILTKRKQLFTHCSKQGINEDVFERALCQYILESLPLQTMSDIVMDSYNEKENEKGLCAFDYPYKNSLLEPNTLLRNLDDHCWLEKFEASVLYQILDKCSELRPYIKKYYCRGNNKLLLVMYNPFNESLYNKISWNGWLHSNVGFRSYLHSVANDINEWVIKKKKSLFNNKEEQVDKTNIMVQAVPPKYKSSYGLKTRIEINTENQLIKDVKELEVSKKLPSQSPELKKAGSKMDKFSASKRKTSENQLSKIKSAKNIEEHKLIKDTKKSYDFDGYNLGDALLHLKSECIYMFPESSCCIKLEKQVFLNGNTYININVIKDDNNFYLEFVNPLTEIEASALNEDMSNTKCSNLRNCDKFNSNETAKLPTLPKYQKNISLYSVFKARFSDGLILSISSSFSQELNTILNKLESSKLESEVIDRSTSTLNLKILKTKQKLKEEESEESRREKVYLFKLEERKCLIKKIIQEQMFLQNLFFTVPNGLRVIFLHNALIEDNNIVDCLRYLTVRLQHIPSSTKINKLEHLNEVSEVYRCVTDDGAVIKYMSNTMIEILYPNGKILKSASVLKFNDDQSTRENDIDLIDWYYTSASGERKFMNNQRITNINTLSTFTVNCLETNQLLKTREDGVIIVDKNGSSVTEFLDGTRISAYSEYSGENFNNFIKIEHDRFPTVIINKTLSDITVQFGNGRQIHGSCNGEYTVSNNGKKEIKISNEGKADIFDYFDEKVGVIELNQSNSLQSLFLKDRHGNQFCVNSLGNLRVEKNPEYETKETILPRYFVINSDGSGEELFNYDSIKTYVAMVENENKSVILKKELENNSDATVYTFIRPLQGASEVWKANNKESSIIPVGLQERDFRTFALRNFTNSQRNLLLLNNEKEIIKYIGFEVRHLIKYKSLNVNIRNLIVKGINNYNKFFLTQQKSKNCFKSLDNRESEEKSSSEKLLKIFRNSPKFVECTKEFKQKIGNNAGDSIIQEYAQTFSSESQSTVKKAHNVSLQNNLKFPSRVINKDLEEAKITIKNLKFPPYFLTDEGQAFLSANSINSDLHNFVTPDSITSFKKDESLTLHQPVSSKEFDYMPLCDSSIVDDSIQESFSSFNSIIKKEKELYENDSIYKNNSKETSNNVDKGFSIKKSFGEIKKSECSHNKQLIPKLHGFIISPDFVDFGILTEGNTYMFPISIKNVGLASSRFSIKQPPPSTGLKLIYNHGLVAPGMTKEINLEIFAVAVGVEGDSGIGQVYHKLDIITELGTLSLPVIATIITQNENFERERPSKGTISLRNSLSFREKINRPPKK